ncbi:hypothetical protein SDC9_165635 [bioreactor metagenome]|uniref:Uncharacterized protein n=1 Tax=bioreactor metagenome TaxID=1076179 RepID=A0A645FUX7_9ZZZZ
MNQPEIQCEIQTEQQERENENFCRQTELGAELKPRKVRPVQRFGNGRAVPELLYGFFGGFVSGNSALFQFIAFFFQMGTEFLRNVQLQFAVIGQRTRTFGYDLFKTRIHHEPPFPRQALASRVPRAAQKRLVSPTFSGTTISPFFVRE